MGIIMNHDRIKQKVTIEIERINAVKARQYLALNVENNRNPRMNTLVKQYAADMVNDNWRFTAESIKFNINDRMFDGQNRLLAIIEADKVRPGISFEFVVARGLQPAAMIVVDGGGKRSPGDALKIAGVHKYEAQKAALAKRILAFEDGSRSVLKAANKSGFDPSKTITKSRIVEYVIRFEDRLNNVPRWGFRFMIPQLSKN